MSDGSGVELAHQLDHAFDAHARAGFAVDIHRLRRTVEEDPHRLHVSDVVEGDDGEIAPPTSGSHPTMHRMLTDDDEETLGRARG